MGGPKTNFPDSILYPKSWLMIAVKAARSSRACRYHSCLGGFIFLQNLFFGWGTNSANTTSSIEVLIISRWKEPHEENIAPLPSRASTASYLVIEWDGFFCGGKRVKNCTHVFFPFFLGGGDRNGNWCRRCFAVLEVKRFVNSVLWCLYVLVE